MVRKSARLLAVLQLGLEADDVPQRAERIVLAQLHDRVRPPAGARVAQADRLHRPEAQGLAARARPSPRSAGSRRNRACRLPLLELGLVAGQQRVDEGVVLRLVHRAVDVVGAVAARARLVVARLVPGDRPGRCSRDGRSARWRRRRRARPRRSARAIASARAGEVRGPVATITLSQSAGGRPATSSRSSVDQRMGEQALPCTAAEKPSGRPPARRRPAACGRRPRA